MCAQGVVMHCTGSDFIKVTTQMKTSENNWEHRKTSKIIWYHPKNNWGPIIDDLVQFEEDFNSRKTSSENSRKTSENSWEHWKTSKIIWYHPENNWGPIIDNLVQFEEDFNSRTKKLRYGGVDWIGYLRPVQFLDHLTVIKPLDHHRLVDYQIVLNYRTIFPYRKSFGWDWIARKYPDFIAKLG